MEPVPSGFPVDEEPLRQWVLKAYQEKRFSQGPVRQALDAVRQFLSGPPGGESVLARYWFEEHPAASVASFIQDLEGAIPGLSRLVLDPLLRAVAQMKKKRSREIAPNLPVYVSSLAGSVAVKSGLDETIASAVLSAAILGLSRVGLSPFEEVLRKA